jgi:EpsI family protein
MTINRFSYYLLAAAALALVCFCYYPTAISFNNRWTSSDGAYTLGYPLLVLCLMLVLRQARPVVNSAIEPYWPAAIPLLALSLLWLFGRISDVMVLQQLAMPALVLLFITALLGRKVGNLLRFPFVLFYAAVPIWDVFNEVLQQITVAVCNLGLTIVGIPAFIEETQITIPAGTFQVAGGCSGLNYLLMLGTIGALFGHFFYRLFWHKVLLLIVAVVFGLLCNWVRVLSLVFVGHTTDMQSPLLGDHEAMGWITFSICLIPFFYVATQIETRDRNRVPAAIAPQEQQQAHWSWLLIVFAATTAAIAGPVLYASADKSVIDSELLGRTLSKSQNTLINYSLEPGWTPAYQNFDQHLVLQFLSKHPEMQVHLITYYSQEQGKELIQWGNDISDNRKWKIVSEQRQQAKSGATANVVNLRSLTGKAEVVYWYSVGGIATASPLLAKVYQLPAFLLGREEASLLAIFYPCPRDDCTEIRQRAMHEVRYINGVYAQALKTLLHAPQDSPQT